MVAREICGEVTHALIKRDATSFKSHTKRLAHSPNEEAFQETSGGGLLWLRNCSCGSTLAYVLREGFDDDFAPDEFERCPPTEKMVMS